MKICEMCEMLAVQGSATAAWHGSVSGQRAGGRGPGGLGVARIHHAGQRSWHSHPDPGWWRHKVGIIIRMIMVIYRKIVSGHRIV